jgi:hypothetical protein
MNTKATLAPVKTVKAFFQGFLRHAENSWQLLFLLSGGDVIHFPLK